jgi:hypothetical protein
MIYKTAISPYSIKEIDAETTFLLDLYSGAISAHSFRLLKSSYTGSCIRVRRSIDNLEQDIGFLNGYLDTASMLTFCGLGNGYIVTWYEQTGLGYDVTNSTASEQPQIVSSGTLITVGGFVASDYDGSHSYLTAGLGNSLNYVDSISLFRVGSSDSIAAGKRLCSDDKIGVQGYFIDYFNNTSSSYNDGTGYITANQSILAASTHFVYSTCVKINGNVEIDFNASNETSSLAAWDGSIGTSGQAGYSIGSGADGGQLYDGKIQEIIIFGSDKSSDKTGIRENQNNYYNVY